MVKVTPFVPSLSAYWQVVIDDGLDGNYIMYDIDGRVKFMSEMAAINYFLGQGWEIYLIQNIETGEAGGATGIFGSLVGGKVTLSKNEYFFRVQYPNQK